MRKRFHHLTQFDRDRLEVLLRAGHTQQEAADVLRVDKSTISRERKRKRKDGRYEAVAAEHKARVQRLGSKYQGMKIEKCPDLREEIIRKLKKKRSPDEIAGRMKKDSCIPRIGTSAIYKWLYSPYGQQYCKYLCTKRYRKRKQKKKTKREMISNRKPLYLRPVFGIHAEGDTAVSPKNAKTSAAALVVCEKESQLLLGQRLPNLKPATIARAANQTIISAAIDTIAWDNGQENRDHEQMDIPAYFCDPHSPWQKPHVETNIGLLRKWFTPKKTDWRTVSEKQFQTYLHILNSKHRKSLGYASAYEIAYGRGIIVEIPKHPRVAFH